MAGNICSLLRTTACSPSHSRLNEKSAPRRFGHGNFRCPRASHHHTFEVAAEKVDLRDIRILSDTETFPVRIGWRGNRKLVAPNRAVPGPPGTASRIHSQLFEIFATLS